MSFAGLTAAAAGFGVALVARDRLAAEQAIGLAGGRVAAACAWEATVGMLDRVPADVLAVDLRGEVNDLEGADVLAGLVAQAAARGVAVVVLIDEPHIDMLGGALFAGPAQLLCQPTQVEWVIALAIAGRGGTGAGRGVREGERDRIAVLTRQMAQLVQELATLVDRDGGADRPADIVADRRRGFAARPDERKEIDPAVVRAVLRARRLRDRHLGAGLFEDPAWDMLLDLFAAALEGTQVSVSSLCIAAAVAPTTALRWIARLADAGLVERAPDALDRRRVHVALSGEARARMADYAAAVMRAGLPFV